MAGERVPAEVTAKLSAEGGVGWSTCRLGKEQLFSGEGAAYAESPRKEKGAKQKAQDVMEPGAEGRSRASLAGVRKGPTGHGKDRALCFFPLVEFFKLLLIAFS